MHARTHLHMLSHALSESERLPCMSLQNQLGWSLWKVSISAGSSSSSGRTTCCWWWWWVCLECQRANPRLILSIFRPNVVSISSCRHYFCYKYSLVQTKKQLPDFDSANRPRAPAAVDNKLLQFFGPTEASGVLLQLHPLL